MEQREVREVRRLDLEIVRDFVRFNAKFIEEAEGRLKWFPEVYPETLEGFYTALRDAWEDYAGSN